MTEAQLQRALTDALRLFGWRVFHPWTAVHSAAGYVDITAVRVRDARLLFAELKSATGRVTPVQRAWLDALGAVQTVETYLWRPADLDQALTVLQ